MTSTTPLTILGGSDLAPSRLPAGAEQHPLAAYKGAALRVGERPLIELAIERFRTCGAFDPILVAGPKRIYAGLDLDAELVDTDSDVATNLRAAIEATRSAGTIAITTCDILPDPAELAACLADLEASRPCDVWFPLVRRPRDPEAIGAFGWKPSYGILPRPGAEPEVALPGHLAVFDPAALRLELLYRLIQVAYRTRNRSVETRRGAMLRALFGELLYQDLLHLFSLRLPDLTWTVLRAGLSLYSEVRSRRIERGELERKIGRIVLRARHRRRHPERGVRLPILDALSLAEDIDTEEEAHEVGARMTSQPDSPRD